MISLALFLLALGLADLMSGGDPGTHQASAKVWRPALVAAVLALLTALLNYYVSRSAVLGALTFGLLFPGLIAWTVPRQTGPQQGARQKLALLSLLATIAAGAFCLPAIQETTAPLAMADYLGSLPWALLREARPEAVLLTLALILFLGPTANAVVRTALELIRDNGYVEPEKQLKGGRYIGPLERVLIFGLVLADEPTAAALIISAKSIIRFPELQSKAARSSAADMERSAQRAGEELQPGGIHLGLPEPQIDELTEYFLIGSLISWALALLATLPLTSAG
jgi:hypothetical protein